MEKSETIVQTALIESYWKLIELNGQPVAFSDGMRREMHMILKKDNNQVKGHGGVKIARFEVVYF